MTTQSPKANQLAMKDHAATAGFPREASPQQPLEITGASIPVDGGSKL
ncbi:hypothetical protein [Edaphobacter dinghuensis]|nr:hypothetical protein [Edaphobacter dinghuensis]